MRNSDHFLFFADKVEGSFAFFALTEWRHAIKVLRVSPETEFQATDGSGRLFSCRGFSSDYTDGRAEITVTNVTPSPVPRIALFVGMPERSAFERVVEEATPLGVSAIIPVVCARCQDKWWAPKWDKIGQRMRNLAVSAVKQSHNPWLPELASPLAFGPALERLDRVVLLADPGGSRLAPGSPQPTEAVSCVVGPPGGFSANELSALDKKGAVRISLGPFRLRTELASIVLALRARQIG